MSRCRLPDRRRTVTFDIDHDGQVYAVALGYDELDGAAWRAGAACQHPRRRLRENADGRSTLRQCRSADRPGPSGNPHRFDDDISDVGR
jgi:hypothetical protein